MAAKVHFPAEDTVITLNFNPDDRAQKRSTHVWYVFVCVCVCVRHCHQVSQACSLCGRNAGFCALSPALDNKPFTSTLNIGAHQDQLVFGM